MTNILKLPRLTTLACLVLVLTGQVFLASSSMGQSSDTQDKIRLMSSAIRARDAGDLQQAKTDLEELLRLAPNDVNVQRLLMSVNKDIERQSQGQQTVYGQAASVREFSPSSTSSTGVQSTSVVAVAGNPNGELITDAQPYTPPSASAELDAVLEAEAASQEMALDMAKAAMADAKKLIKAERYADADALLADAQSALTLNTATAPTIEKIREMRGDIILDQGNAALKDHNAAEAATYLAQYREKLGDDQRAREFETKVTALENNPWYQNPEELSPDFMQNQSVVDQLMVKARAQMLYGDLEGSAATLREVEARDPNNSAAKGLQIEIMQQLKDSNYLDHSKTRDAMLQEVARSWQRPQIFQLTPTDTGPKTTGTLLEKLARIEIPRVSFAQVPLSRVVETLSELSVEYDKVSEDSKDKGVNIVPANWGGNDPMVSITLRNLSLDKILDFVTQSVDYTWDVQNDAVVVRPGDEGNYLETDFFPISRGVVIRLTGVGESSSGGGSNDPFAPAAPSGGGNSTSDTEQSLLRFFQKAGVPFESTSGSSLAFDGTQLIVTQTPKNLEKMRNILRRYDQPKQVEIEAKFLEVNQGVLDEMAINWNINTPLSAVVGPGTQVQTGNRSLSSAFSINSATSNLVIDQGPVDVGGIVVDPNPLEYPQTPPSLPNTIDLGQAGGLQANVGFSIMGTNVQAVISALSRKQGSDLLSSPRLTVLSGRTAQIVVAQELRYPENYSDIESEVGSTSSSTGSSGSAGVTITAGTPQDFTVRNVGVEMEVTPTVEENQNISLKLEPRVTEFEGFVEYGGTSVAISSGTTVSVPSGFYQPIFSTREVRTEVTVFDGATVVIGGLTREEIKTVNDKVPLLGDIPLLGRLFQSKGETSTKKNLLIFVTANLISPGGSPSGQRLRNVEANSLFQNPILVTPGGGISREISEQ
ncbi:type II secretory pathway, component PulD [Ruficoccus amylovorans]|uniref:Type II secretory pathway, component PulD n=1 Tax=Ruficoccus amylovorans TaxID=1804625 RepID=A0A842HGK5_9BACT|nr:type II secretory pathway, component PulD [Ruficoccus amylovorans]MBC2594684.1 type II secretory pathway, component PulD [Ruficoccus amylovorans]